MYKYSIYKAQKNLLGDKYAASSTYSRCAEAEAYAKGGNQCINTSSRPKRNNAPSITGGGIFRYFPVLFFVPLRRKSANDPILQVCTPRREGIVRRGEPLRGPPSHFIRALTIPHCEIFLFLRSLHLRQIKRRLRASFLFGNNSNFDRNPLRGCNYGLEGVQYFAKGRGAPS